MALHGDLESWAGLSVAVLVRCVLSVRLTAVVRLYRRSWNSTSWQRCCRCKLGWFQTCFKCTAMENCWCPRLPGEPSCRPCCPFCARSAPYRPPQAPQQVSYMCIVCAKFCKTWDSGNMTSWLLLFLRSVAEGVFDEESAVVG